MKPRRPSWRSTRSRTQRIPLPEGSILRRDRVARSRVPPGDDWKLVITPDDDCPEPRP
jgi:hypothetical protein